MKIGSFLDQFTASAKIALCHVLFYPYILKQKVFGQNKTMLHVGCGSNRIDGWINADIDPRADLIIFMEKRLPFANDSLQYIYSEHVLEHVPFETGVFFLSETLRTLQKGGVVRIAMPDLDVLVDAYQGDWRKELHWVNWPEYSFLKTKAQMINIAFRWWGHKHLYNQEELKRALSAAGFTKMSFQPPGKSGHEKLQNLETRQDTNLIVEATK